MWHEFNHGFGMMGGWGWILGVILLVMLIWLIVRVSSYDRYIKSANKSALDILKERYAKGEIDKTEFDAKKKDILSQ